MLLCGVLSGCVGCNGDVAGEVVTLSGVYLGDVVTATVTGYLHDPLGTEGSGSTAEHSDDEHSHEAGPLHDHEH